MLQRRLAHVLAERLLRVQSHSVQAQSTLSYFKGGWASFMRGPTFHASKSVRQAHITFLVPRKKMQALLVADRLRASPVRFTAQRAVFRHKKRVVVLWRTSPLKHDNTLFMPVSGRLSTCLQVPNTMAD